MFALRKYRQNCIRKSELMTHRTVRGQINHIQKLSVTPQDQTYSPPNPSYSKAGDSLSDLLTYPRKPPNRHKFPRNTRFASSRGPAPPAEYLACLQRLPSHHRSPENSHFVSFQAAKHPAYLQMPRTRHKSPRNTHFDAPREQVQLPSPRGAHCVYLQTHLDHHICLGSSRFGGLRGWVRAWHRGLRG
jgi:hypothetical protein